MQKIILTTLIVFCFSSVSFSATQKLLPSCAERTTFVCDTNIHILDSIMGLNLSEFIGLPVDSLLNKLPVSAHTIKFGSADNPRIVSRLIISYDNWYWVQIVVRKFQYMSPISPNRTWDINLFKKEKISWIFVNRGNTCVFGCTSTKYRN